MTSKAGAGSKGHVSRALKHTSDDRKQDDGSSDAIPGEEEEEGNKIHEKIDREREAKSNGQSGEAMDERRIGQLIEEATLPPEPDLDTPRSEISSTSGVDDLPSVQASVQDSLQDSVRTSPTSSIAGSRASRRSSYHASPSSQPFERRFKARISSGSPVPRAIAPAFLSTHSRQSSNSSQLTLRSQDEDKMDSEEERKPWEVIRWTKLRKITQQAFSESGKRAFGHPTFLSVGASIAVGTSKGIILLFDYQQTLKSIIGQGTLAAECGAITSLALTADHTNIAGGHANGSIFTWELSRPAKPFLQIPPVSRTELPNRKMEGHITDCAVLHVGFLGQRHTALVSADDNGMAFSHLATRGLGAVTRSVKTTRILGRYPVPSGPPRKPSSVLAFGPLPLGNIQQATDNIGLTALLTPYLLVLISTTPVAQTQYKCPRPKEMAAHSAMTGCLAWFPAVTLQSSSEDSAGAVSHTKLVYCWSNLLYILEVREKDSGEPDQTEKPREFEFRQRDRWTCDEAILAVQWLSRSTIVVLTITQRLIILQDSKLHMVDSSDLINKHIFHQDSFSRQLQPLVDKIIQGDESLHGVLPDAYHMSFKAYKGRLFILGMNDVSMGTLSNWADRLTAMLVAGRPIEAIELATSYYAGDVDKITIGLSEDTDRRHAMVHEKLLELMSSSLRHIMNDEGIRDTEEGLRSALEDFARVSFIACAKMNVFSFMFDEVYEKYSEMALQDIFLHELEAYILRGEIDLVPPEVLQDILMVYEGHDLGLKLAQILCSLQPSTMDIERVTGVCRRMRLYDALIHVWNEAADDFVSPLVDLMSLIPTVEQAELGGEEQGQGQTGDAMKIFPYLAYTLTGRSYPGGAEMSEQRTTEAQASVYSFLFSVRTLRWPPPNGELVHAGSEENARSRYPYLRQLLDFGSYEFLTMINEAFEDSFLNRDQNQAVNGTAGQESTGDSFGTAMTRQRIISILLEVIVPPDYDPQDKVLLDIFLARNLAKFRQEILLRTSVLDRILVELCTSPINELAEECQLSVEYLLTVHRPHHHDRLISLLDEAGFFRVLKSTYRRGKQYAQWLETHFRDMEDRQAVFDCIAECLHPGSGLSKRQTSSVKAVITEHDRDLVDINAPRTATTLETFAPDLLNVVFATLEDGSNRKFLFLKALLEPSNPSTSSEQHFRREHQEEYIELLCRNEPQHVSNYVGNLESGSLQLDKIMPALESSGVIDAAVILLQHDGLAREAINRLIKHLATLRTALASLLDTVGETNPDQGNTEETVDDLLQSLEKYVKLGIWLCQGEVGKKKQGSDRQAHIKRSFQYTEDDLTTVEMLWLDLIDGTIALNTALPSTEPPQSSADAVAPRDATIDTIGKATQTLRALVQTTFTAVLASSSTPNPSKATAEPASPRLSREPAPIPSYTPRFPALLSTLLTRLSTHTTTRTILPLLSNLLTSYAFESSILSLASHFLSSDIFALIASTDASRRRGWRPSARACEVCGRRCWGPGAGVGNWNAWLERGELRGREAKSLFEEKERNEAGRRRKGKARVLDTEDVELGDDGDVTGVREEKEGTDALVVFKCQHLFHRRCLEGVLGKMEGDADVVVEYKCPVCA